MGIKNLAGSCVAVFAIAVTGYAAYDAYPTIKRKFIETKDKISNRRKEKVVIKF